MRLLKLSDFKGAVSVEAVDTRSGEVLGVMTRSSYKRACRDAESALGYIDYDLEYVKYRLVSK